jgi:hypothetical protein
MKKMFFMLTALLLAVPAMANVSITCQQVGDTNEVQILYDASGDDANRPRAFGLQISTDVCEILSVSGEPVYPTDDNDYWVYPGSIDIDTNEPPSVVGQGSPVVGSLPASSIIIEMGSLHYPPEVTSPNAPSSSGVLLSVYVSGDCNVTVAEDATRGGVVNYAAEPATNNLPYTCDVNIAEGCWTGDAASRAEWESVDSPDCWCASVQPRQCHGDADGRSQGKGNYWVGSDDLNVFVAALNKNYDQIQGQFYNHTGPPPYTTLLICADYDHLAQGKGQYRVGSDDLNIFVKWLNTPNMPDPNCLDVTGNQDDLVGQP